MGREERTAESWEEDLVVLEAEETSGTEEEEEEVVEEETCGRVVGGGRSWDGAVAAMAFFLLHMGEKGRRLGNHGEG